MGYPDALDGLSTFVVVSIGGILLVGSVLVGGITLRMAVRLYNRSAGWVNSPLTAPEPTMSDATFVTFVVGLVNVLVHVLLKSTAQSATAAGVHDGIVIPGAIVVRLGMGILIMSIVVSLALAMEFREAFLVSLCHILIVAVTWASIVAITSIVMPLAG